MSTIDIQHNEERQRFEALVDNQLCVLEYVRDGNTVSMNHVRVPEAVGGRGIAGEITRYALDWARDKGLRVVANCPYVARWIERHPEYEQLLT
ncbi:GNAT family N-acetyltransferase [Wenzhouxiangella sediminis]|uniref:N-acetyltransferase n=1 Tax=Wenzhouxiangella sediminis TaxID=1792836 RepID=A0A3E1KC08_9GAMM|nr:GNAT family N-acetyltransferase [Wenzhouxiangella sediminis]RFF32262.1 N-acetyltransferase [Wenzhouxiangella sediminis]